MNVKLVLKRLLVLAGAGCAFVLLLAVVVPLFISGETVREQVVQAVGAATGARVELGEARVRLLPRLSVRLRDGRLAGDGAGLRAAQGDDFGVASYEAELAGVQVTVALLPLLNRRIEVDEVTVTAPRLHLLRDGRELTAEQVRLTIGRLSLPAEPAPRPAPGAAPGELIPAALSCRAALAVGKVTLDKVSWQDVEAEASLDGRVIGIASFKAGLGDGGLSGQGTLDYAGDPWGTLRFSAEATDVTAADLLGPWAPGEAGRLEGTLQLVAAGGCSLRDAEAARATLELAGTLRARDGVLHAADWLRDVSPYLGARQDLKDIRFATLDHAFRAEQGRWLVDDLVLDGGETRWQANGSVGLDGDLDLVVHVKLPPGFTPSLGQWSFLAETLRDPDGRVQLDLLLSGPAARPAVGLDLSRLKAGAADPGGEALKKGVGSLLDKWKNR